MKTIDLANLEWKLSGWTPFLWKLRNVREASNQPDAEIAPFAVNLPGSVQKMLRDAGILPDWNTGLCARECEWVENRHWLLTAELETAEACDCVLKFERLDGCGEILWDGETVGTFGNSFLPQSFPLGKALTAPGKHTLTIAFELPPRWLGQFGFTSRTPLVKPRWNYTWDWTPRLVQTAVDGFLRLEQADTPELLFEKFDTTRDGFHFRLSRKALLADSDAVEWRVCDGKTCVAFGAASAQQAYDGFSVRGLNVTPWMPNGLGKAKLYRFVLSAAGAVLERRIGFRNFERRACPGAPTGALPWHFAINGEPFFVQGINWTPILPNRADATEADYRRLVGLYRDMGVNFFRVWGGADREKELFYDLCDEAGIMVWQEFPLCSAGIENLPPSDPETLAVLEQIANAYCDALNTHVSLTMWCGGNELFSSGGSGRPCNGSEPALRLLANLLRRRDPARPFVPTSASGETEYCELAENGRGLHHDVHGPWTYKGTFEEDWKPYWSCDDALFRSEFGCPGAASEKLIRKYAGNRSLMPVASENPLWRNPLSWWFDGEAFARENGGGPESVAAYVSWSQFRQCQALDWAIRCARKRYPACGGLIIWMGHDSFPCFTNTSLVDFDGEPKPAYYTVKKLFTAKIAVSAEENLKTDTILNQC